MNFFYYRLIPEKIYIERRFKKKQKYNIDFIQPQSLNEKIQWLKLYDRKKEYSRYVDKYEVRKFIKETIGEKYLIPLLDCFNDISDLKKIKYPGQPCIIKATHNSGGTIIIKSENDFDYNFIYKKAYIWFNENYYYKSKEYQYKYIHPKVIIEKLLISKTKKLPYDYKFHCFNGKVEIIQVDIDRFSVHKRNFYDKGWNLLPFTWCPWEDDNPLWINGKELIPPRNLDEMISISEKLSKDFAYIRIDLYELDGLCYFGELTFHHGGGFERIEPFGWDIKLGEKLNLSVV